MAGVDHIDIDVARQSLIAKGGQVGKDASLSEKVVLGWQAEARGKKHVRKDDASAVFTQVSSMNMSCTLSSTVQTFLRGASWHVCAGSVLRLAASLRIPCCIVGSPPGCLEEPRRISFTAELSARLAMSVAWRHVLRPLRLSPVYV